MTTLADALLADIAAHPGDPTLRRVKYWNLLRKSQLLGCGTRAGFGTQADNVADAVRHGRTLKGAKNPSAKLTPNRARLIRELVADGFRIDAVQQFFGLGKGTVERVLSGQTWSESGES